MFVALAVADESFSSTSVWVRFALEQIGYRALIGAGAGAAGAFLVQWSTKRGWIFRRALSVVADTKPNWTIKLDADRSNVDE